MYMLASTLLKLSLLLLYQRIFNVDRRTRYAIRASMVLVPLYYGTAMVLLLSICMPRNVRNGSASGGRSRESYKAAHQRCVRRQVGLNIASSVFNAASDLLLLLLPLPLVWGLQLPLRRKVGVTLLFITGLVYVTSACEPLPTSPRSAFCCAFEHAAGCYLAALGRCCLFFVSGSNCSFVFDIAAACEAALH
jgi:hypothetical protein